MRGERAVPDSHNIENRCDILAVSLSEAWCGVAEEEWIHGLSGGFSRSIDYSQKSTIINQWRRQDLMRGGGGGKSQSQRK